MLSQGILIAGDVTIYEMVVAGAGRHLPTLPNPVESALAILKWNSVYQVINITGAFFTKLSIGIFLLRLKSTRQFKLTIWAFLAPLAITTLVLDLVVLLQCVPLEALWTPTIEGRCIPQEVPLKFSYLQSAFAILADLFLTVSPMVILWNVRISWRKKIGIWVLMSLGLMATVANALRNAFIPNLSEADLTCMLLSSSPPPATYFFTDGCKGTVVPVIIVANLEFSLGVIAACVPTLVPLFKTHFGSKSYSKMGAKSRYGAATEGTFLKGQSNNGSTFNNTQISTAKDDRREYPLNKMTKSNHIALEQSYSVEHTSAV